MDFSIEASTKSIRHGARIDIFMIEHTKLQSKNLLFPFAHTVTVTLVQVGGSEEKYRTSTGFCTERERRACDAEKNRVVKANRDILYLLLKDRSHSSIVFLKCCRCPGLPTALHRSDVLNIV